MRNPLRFEDDCGLKNRQISRVREVLAYAPDIIVPSRIPNGFRVYPALKIISNNGWMASSLIPVEEFDSYQILGERLSKMVTLLTERSN